MVPIGSPLMVSVSYLTPLCLTLYLSRYSRYLMCKLFCDLDLGQFKVIRCHTSFCESIAYGLFPIRFLLTSSSYLSPVLKHLTCNFDELEPAQIKFFQSQRSLCQSEAHWWFPLCPTLHLSRHSKYLLWKFFDLHLERFKVIQVQR